MDLGGRTALVTGGNRGIGLEACRQLGKAGARILLGCRNMEKGEKAESELREEQIDVSAILLDVANRESVVSVAQEFSQEVDILINNAAILDRGQLERLDYSELEEVIRTDLLGPVILATRLSEGMRKRNWGRIVHVTSGMGALSRGLGPDSIGYRLSKLALNGFTLCLAESLRGTNVLVNSVDPGWVRTSMGGPNAGKTPEEGARSIVRAVLLPDNGPSGSFFRDGRKIDW